VEPQQGFRSLPQLVLGLLIVAVGVLLTMDTLGYADVGNILRYWPAGFIVLGLARLVQSRDGGGSGIVLILIGTWLLFEVSLNALDISILQLWPLFLVLVGASLVWRSIAGKRPPAPDSDALISGMAVLGGVNRGSTSQNFRGGDLTAVLGGCEIDLRRARIDGEAVIDVFAMWGGIEIKVPEDWTVISRVTPLLGGVDDKTRPAQPAGNQRLIVRGLVVMGGVEIKN
jgi:predicted membrane protein